MKVISIPKSAYQKLVKKAQLWDRILNLVKDEYPIEDYTGERIREFQSADRVPARLRKNILAILKDESA